MKAKKHNQIVQVWKPLSKEIILGHFGYHREFWTRFQVSDKAWIVLAYRVQKVEILKVQISLFDNPPTVEVEYFCKLLHPSEYQLHSIFEQNVYRTRQEARNSMKALKGGEVS